ncbi:MAG: flagellar filament protein FlaA [Spirochaetales bacterium]|nr:flagellar filament protein FlaA [Spirochaetales bacterium]
MKRRNLFILLFLLTAGVLLAQNGMSRVGEADPSQIGVDTAQQLLKEVSVTKFEDAGFWTASIPRDLGFVTVRRIEGGPEEKEPIEDEEALGIEEADDYVLGVKVQFYKRSMTHFAVYPSHPLAIEGITKTLSVWVIGRNTKHTLKVLISDTFGKKAELTVGTLNFSGWKRMTVAIPTSIVQRDYHYNNKMGIKVEGFLIECDPAETVGNYYIYFDDLRATTDLFSEVSRDTDDIQDVW